MNPLQNKKVHVRISDPWELGELIQWKALEATIVNVESDNILIKLLNPFAYKGNHCEFFVVTPRHEGDHLEKLRNGKSLFCGLTRITSEQANANNPFDLQSWRGGVVAIGNIDPI